MSNSVFGPVPSRRLGRSLGVDLVPYKTCTFDCIYCELGPTTCLTKKRRSFKAVDSIYSELKGRLDQLNGELDYITLAGSGEPTLNSDLGMIIEGIKRMTRSPLAILTNSSLLSQSAVRDELKPLDLIVPSLDTMNKGTFHKINRPVEGIEPEDVIEGLIKLREVFTGSIWLEVFVCRGINDSNPEIDLIKKAVDLIKPDKVQINTVFRPPAVEGVMPVSEERLKQIEVLLGAEAGAAGGCAAKKQAVIDSRSVRKRTLMLLKRRPCSIEDILTSLCIERNAIIEVIDKMVKAGEITCIRFKGKVFYKA